MDIVLVTGGFDPIHSGHIEYFKEAKRLGDKLIVGLNSDAWLERKKGRAFMPIEERIAIVQSIKYVDGIVRFQDDDNTAIDAIRKVKLNFPSDKIIFANGGDRTQDNIPEMSVTGVEFAFSVGGSNKKNSSSWILDEWKAPKTERPWGYYRVLHEQDGTKVKELTVMPGQSLSMQRHSLRAEHWLVSEGQCEVLSMMDNGYQLPPKTLIKHNTFTIDATHWHKLSNPFNEPCKIVEIQYGFKCDENDIERR